MSAILIPQAPTLPEGYCPTSWQAVFDAIAQDFNWVITGDIGFHVGDSPPDDLTQLWFRTIAGEPDGWYMWVGAVGLWLSLHPVEADNRWLYMWDGDESAIWSVDGGDGTNPGAIAPTLYTGSFWEVAVAMEGMMPVGVGTLQPSGTVLNQGDEGGEDEHTLTVAELAEHTHPVETGPTTSGDDGGASVTSGSAPAHPTIVFPDAFAGSDEPHENMPPYRAIYFVRRTIRKYKSAS